MSGGAGVAALVVLGGLLLSGCSPEPPQLLRVGTSAWTGYEPLCLARETGILRQDETRLVEYASATDVIRALRNRTIDAGAMTLDEAALLASKGRRIRIVTVLDISNGGDVLLARPEFTSLGELRGRKVGVETTALGAYFLSRALEVGGLERGDVEVVSVDVSEHERAYGDGRVDAVVTFEPAASHLVAAGARRLFDSSRIPGEIVDVLVIDADAAVAKREQVTRLVAAWFEALSLLEKDPRAAAAVIAPRQRLSPEAYLESLKGLRFPNAAENRAFLGGSRPALAGPFSSLVAEMLRSGLLPRPMEIAPLLDPGFLPEERP